ncbi:hypothetical protein BHE74_00058625 [Ensete ventricosum]|nr:hypothetical protein BHE74_00058625 [Ensete ventricosum]
MPVPPLTGEALCPEHSVTKPSSLHRALISPSASTVPSYGEPTAPTEERSPFLASLRGHRPSQIEIALSHLCSTTSPNVALALQPVLFIANQITTGNEHQPPPTSSLLHRQSLLFLVVHTTLTGTSFLIGAALHLPLFLLWRHSLPLIYLVAVDSLPVSMLASSLTLQLRRLSLSAPSIERHVDCLVAFTAPSSLCFRPTLTIFSFLQ